jgi:nitrogen fixation protein NifM
MTTTDKLDLAYLKLQTALNLYQKSPADLDSTQLAEVSAQTRHQYDIEVRVLASPEARDITVSSSQLDHALTEIQSYYSDDNQFQQELANNGLSYEGLRDAVARQLRVETVLEQVAARADPVNELDAKIYYYMHPDQFQQPETRTVRQILIAINPKNPENTRRSARKRLFNIAIRLRRKPQSFAEQAKKYSECPNASEGGLIGQVSPGTLSPELDEVLFVLQENEISRIIESPVGFHLLLCEAIHPSGASLSFEEAEPHILELLQARRGELYQKNWLEQLPAVKTENS